MQTKFKIGQKVQVTRRGSIGHYLREGSVATITSLHSNSMGAQRYNVQGVGDRGETKSQIIGEDQMKAVGFKVGDRVRIAISGYGTHPKDIGKIVTVTKAGTTYSSHEGIEYDTTGLEIDELAGRSHRYTAATLAFELAEHLLDFTKPLFTAEGTPVALVTTTNPRDAKFPVLVYEGSASLPTKYTVNGVAKNREARRFLTNEVPKVEPVVTEMFVALLDPKGNREGQQVATKLYPTADAARRGSGASARSLLAGGPIGIAKVTLVSGRWPK